MNINEERKKKDDFPLGIEEFLKRSNIYKRFEISNPHEDSSKFYNSIIYFAKINDASSIIDLHNKVYNGFYPYREILDKDFVLEFLKDKKRGIMTLYRYKQTNEIIGCSIMSVLSEIRTGYFRGLMILPEHSGKIDIIKGVCTMAERGYNEFYDSVDKWYGESRSSHNKGQFMMEYIGNRQCGIFPNKDIFYGNSSRESVVLGIVYPNRTLKILRNNKPVLLPCFKDLYKFIADQYFLSKANFIESSLKITPKIMGKIMRSYEKISIIKDPAKYDKTHYYFFHGSVGIGEFLVTNASKSAEGMVFYTNDFIELASLLIKIRNIIDLEDLDYFECYIPAKDVNLQKMFFELNYTVFGYAPAWLKDENGKLNDCVIFGRVKQLPKYEDIKLTERSKNLLKELKPFWEDAYSLEFIESEMKFTVN